MGNGGFTEAEMIGDCAGRKISLAQQLENRAARVVIESLENRSHGTSIIRQISKYMGKVNDDWKMMPRRTDC